MNKANVFQKKSRYPPIIPYNLTSYPPIDTIYLPIIGIL